MIGISKKVECCIYDCDFNVDGICGKKRKYREKHLPVVIGDEIIIFDEEKAELIEAIFDDVKKCICEVNDAHDRCSFPSELEWLHKASRTQFMLQAIRELEKKYFCER